MPAFCFCGAVKTDRTERMHKSQGTISQKIARAARAFEKLRTKHGRKWVAVYLNEDTMVIALHGSLSAAEKVLAQSPAGAARIQEFHQQLFTNDSAALFRKIKSITGMEVCDTTAEIEPRTGSVVHVFTTDTVGEEFLFAVGGPTGIRARGHSPPSRCEGSARREANKTGCVIRG